MQRGYLKLWRKIQDHRVYQNADLLKLFLHLLLNANIIDKAWNGDVIRRGELATGREGLAKDLRERPSTIYKRLQTLAGPNYDLIRLRSNNQYTVVTILNYDTYQPSKIETEQQGSSEVAARYQQGSTTKELKNSLKEGDARDSVEATRITLLKIEFDSARKSYPGTRGGLTVEWDNFEKKNRDHLAEIVPKLLPAILAEKAHKAEINKTRSEPLQWKHFSTWINKRCWEQELEVINAQNGSRRGNPGPYESAGEKLERANAEFLRDLEARRGGGGHPPDLHVGTEAPAHEGLRYPPTRN